MGYSITLTLPIAKTDANKTRGKNHFAMHSMFEKIKTEISLQSIKQRPLEPLKNFQLTIERRAPRSLDYDNLISSFKPYIDGLRLAGIIEDDSWKYIKHITVSQVTSQEKVLVITVKETSAE